MSTNEHHERIKALAIAERRRKRGEVDDGTPALSDVQATCQGCDEVVARSDLKQLATMNMSPFCSACRALLVSVFVPTQARAEGLDTYYRRTYGLTFSNYSRMYLSQRGKCAICHLRPAEQQLFVDHCHRTDRVRGLLCRGCNSGLGMFRDDTTALARAIVYLNESATGAPKIAQAKAQLKEADGVSRAKERKRQLRKEHFIGGEHG